MSISCFSVALVNMPFVSQDHLFPGMLSSFLFTPCPVAVRLSWPTSYLVKTPGTLAWLEKLSL